MTTIPPHLSSAFDAIFGYIDAARAIVQAGQMPDMVGLDKRVGELCASIEQSEPDIRQACLPKLDMLLQRLDICETELRATQQQPNKEKIHDE